MKIAVIGASGRSGRAFVEVALRAGHTVRAGVFGTSSLSEQDNLSVVKCDATSTKDLKRLITGQDAVVSLIGHISGSPSDVQTKATKDIVKVMNELGMKRFVSLTGTGVRFAGDKLTLLDRFSTVGIKLLDPERIQDGIDHAEVLKGSNLNWTIIRVLKLQNTTPRSFKLLENGPTKLYVSRVEVAQAILQVLEQKSFIKKAPIIGAS